MAEWYEEYLGKPWAPTPNPPESFTCGELLRYVFKREFGFDALPIPVPDARNLHDCVEAMSPEYFGLKLVMGLPRDKDAIFLRRRHMMDHCGLVCMIGGQMWILHCSQRGGVQLSSLAELEAEGYGRHSYWRCPKAESLPLEGKVAPKGPDEVVGSVPPHQSRLCSTASPLRGSLKNIPTEGYV